MTAPATEFSFPDATDIDPEDRDFPEQFTVPDASKTREERRPFLDYVTKRDRKDDDSPRRGRGRPRAAKPRKRASTPKKGAFVEPLMQMYGLVGLTIKMRGDDACGDMILEQAEKCAESVDELAYQNESVRRVLDSLLTTSAIGLVVAAHAPILVAVASHHGGGKIPFIPAPVPPENQ